MHDMSIAGQPVEPTEHPQHEHAEHDHAQREDRGHPHAGSTPTPAEPEPEPGAEPEAAGPAPVEATSSYAQFVAAATRERAAARKKQKKTKRHGDGRPGDGRPEDWADPDPGATLKLPPGQHPVDRALARSRSGKARDSAAGKLRLAWELLAGAEQLSFTPDDVRAYPIHQLTVEDAADYRELIYGRYPAQSSRNDMISMVRRVLRQCYRKGLMSALRQELLFEELYTVAPGRSPQRERFTREEIAALMVACATIGTAKARVRNLAILVLFRLTGMRVAELVKLQLADWNPAASTLLLRFTKNKRDHVVYLLPEAVPYLEAWLRVRGDAPGAMFTPLTGTDLRSLDPVTVRYMLSTRAEAAGVERFGGHDFRRTFVTELLDSGHDYKLVGDLVNHVKPASTGIYDLRGEREQRRAVASLRLPSLDDLLAGGTAAGPAQDGGVAA